MAGTKMKTQDPGSRSLLPPCRVCGDKAAGFHYGVNTCEACKGFFHRSLKRHSEYSCRANRSAGYCDYRPGKRKSCQFCRYQRCLQAGMSKEAIKTGRYTYLKRTEDTQEIKRLQDLEYDMIPDTDVSYLMSDLSASEIPSPNIFLINEDRIYNNPGYQEGRDPEEKGRKGGVTTSTDISPKHKETPHRDINSPVIAKQSDTSSIICTDPSPCCHGDTGNLSVLPHNQKIQSYSNSAIYNLIINAGNRKGTDTKKKRKIDFSERNRIKKCLNASKDSLAETKCVSQNVNSSSKESTCATFNNSVLLTTKKQSRSVKNLEGPAFDLFPDITFCLDDHPIASPVPISDEIVTDEIATPSELLFSLTDRSPESASVSPAPCPGMVMLNLDSGKRLALDDEDIRDGEVCGKQEPMYPIRDDNLESDLYDNVTIQIMEEYTQSMDFIVESPQQTQTNTLMHALLTSPESTDVNSESPLSSCEPDIDFRSLTILSPTSKLMNRVKNMHITDVSELYVNMDEVISALMVSHKENIGDFNYLSKEEMAAQQRAHYESCQLKSQTFGDMGFLPDQEYDDIYSVTGMDIDNRRMIIQKYLSRMERCVRGLVHFAKAIPGFSHLDISTQGELIKSARSEIAIFTMYPTVNLELGVTLCITGEQWKCHYDMGKAGWPKSIRDYMKFCDRLQRLGLTKEEEVILKAILIVSIDRDSTVKSPLAEAIQWQLVSCLAYSLEKHRGQPSICLARYILALTQSRTVAETFKDFLRHLKMQKYSSIEQNPLMRELFSGILQEKEGEVTWHKPGQHMGEGKAGMWSQCLLEYPVTFYS